MNKHQKACACYLKFHIKTNHHILSSWFLIIIYSLDQVTIKSRHNGKQSHHTNRGKIDDNTIKYISNYTFEISFRISSKVRLLSPLLYCFLIAHFLLFCESLQNQVLSFNKGLQIDFVANTWNKCITRKGESTCKLNGRIKINLFMLLPK